MKLHMNPSDPDFIFAREEHLQIRRQLELERQKPQGLWAQLKEPHIRKRFFTGLFVQCLAQSTGVLVTSNYQVMSFPDVPGEMEFNMPLAGPPLEQFRPLRFNPTSSLLSLHLVGIFSQPLLQPYCRPFWSRPDDDHWICMFPTLPRVIPSLQDLSGKPV